MPTPRWPGRRQGRASRNARTLRQNANGCPPWIPCPTSGKCSKVQSAKERPGPGDTRVVDRRAEGDVPLLEQHRAGDALQARGRARSPPARFSRTVVSTSGSNWLIASVRAPRAAASAPGSRSSRAAKSRARGRPAAARSREAPKAGALGPDGEVLLVEHAQRRGPPARPRGRPPARRRNGDGDDRTQRVPDQDGGLLHPPAQEGDDLRRSPPRGRRRPRARSGRGPGSPARSRPHLAREGGHHREPGLPTAGHAVQKDQWPPVLGSAPRS